MTAHVELAILVVAEMLTFDGLGASLRKSLWLCLEDTAHLVFGNPSHYVVIVIKLKKCSAFALRYP